MTKRIGLLLVATLLAGLSSINAKDRHRNSDPGARHDSAVAQGSGVVALSAASSLPSPRRILTVEDSKGNFVGLLVDPVFGMLARRVGDVVVLLGLDPYTNGFSIGDSEWFETTDCSGQAYMDVFTSLTPFASVRPDLTVIYPAAPYVTRTVVAYEYGGDTQENCLSYGGTFLPPDRCCLAQPNYPQTILVGPMTTGGSLGELTPPFHVEGL